jgi:hypothetical protein
MRKKLLFFLTILFISNSYAQELYLLTGNNFTKYEFDANGQSMSTSLQSGTGTTYEIGYAIPIRNKDFLYSFAVNLNNYNALAGNAANSYEWNTKYLGAQAALQYNQKITSFFSLTAKAGVNLSTIIYGKQSIDGEIFDLINQKEFSGLFVGGAGSIHTNYKINTIGFLSLGYGYSYTISTSNSSQEKLSFITNQILLGIHFTINP